MAEVPEFTGVVAIDGPSGSGKSTAARGVAQALRAHYLDTGAMYRAITLAALEAEVPPSDDDAVRALLEKVSIEITTDPTQPTISVDGRRVDAEIRGSTVTAAVSAIAAVPEVRRSLVAHQQRIIAGARADAGDRCGIVVEGRDIGTAVAPDATLKVYLTAAAHTRAQRRHSDGTVEGNVESIVSDLDHRDTLDSTRTTDPLCIAPDATILDTTELSVSQVVDRLLDMLRTRV